MFVPEREPRNLDVNDLNVEDHHFFTPAFWSRAGKTGMQPTMIPTAISVVLLREVSIFSRSDVDENTYRTT
jgi:hypothetical protein